MLKKVNAVGKLARSACKTAARSFTHRQNAFPDGDKLTRILASVGKVKPGIVSFLLKPTFIGKQNQIPISTSKVQVTAAPIPFLPFDDIW